MAVVVIGCVGTVIWKGLNWYSDASDKVDALVRCDFSTADGTQGTNGTDGVEVKATPTWRAATEAELKAGTQLYWKTVNGPDPWATVVSGEIQAKPDGDRLVLVRFPTGVEEWKSVAMISKNCLIPWGR